MKKYEKLLLDGINDEIKGTKIEKLVQIKENFEQAMVYGKKQASSELLESWLRGLCDEVYVPYMNDSIIEWLQSGLKTKIPESIEYKMIAGYWHTAGNTLYHMLYD